MAVHPTSHSSHLAVASGTAHGLALVSLFILFLGTCGLYRLLNGADRLAFCGLVVFGFAAVAVMNAAAVSGWVVPNIQRLMEKSDRSSEPQWRIAIASIFQLNQAWSRIYAIAISAAIVLWSLAALRQGGLRQAGLWQGGLGRPLAIYGCLAPAVLALLVISGHLGMDVHGFTIVTVTQGIWFFWAGLVLCRRNEVTHSPA